MAAAGPLKIAGYQVPAARNDLFADRADPGMGGVLWPAIGASKDLHDLVGAFALEDPRFYQHAWSQLLATDRAGADADALLAHGALSVRYKARVLALLALGIRPVAEQPEEPEQYGADRCEYRGEYKIIHACSIARR